MQTNSKVNIAFAGIAVALFGVIVVGLTLLFVLGQPGGHANFGWYLFAFATGITMIVLPCTLPLAFVIVPMAMGKGPWRGLGIALAFGLGVALMLSMYGVLAAVVGGAAQDILGTSGETLKNWLYFVAGLFALLFSLGEIGLIRFRMPSYTGSAPAFIQKRKDFLKAFFLGIFLGNIGVGCPHPATPLLFVEIAREANLVYGWSLFFTHVVGRLIPLFLLVILAILGVNGLQWLVARKDRVERATGWGMVFVGAFILVLGLFSHDWWEYSGQHTLFEQVTQEEQSLGYLIQKLGLKEAPHTHGLADLAGKTGLFGLPLWLGNWALAFLWLLPVWWYYLKRKKMSTALPDEERKKEETTRPYRFWLSVSWTVGILFLVVWILPERFRLQSTALEHEEVHLMEEEPAGTADDHGTMEVQETHGHGSAFYHNESDVAEGFIMSFRVGAGIQVNKPVTLDFFANEKPSEVPVTDLEIEHEKRVHVIGLRDDLNEFFHLHPTEVSPGLWRVTHTFAKPGTYRVWTDTKHDGAVHTFRHEAFVVEGEGARSEKEVSFADNVMVGKYQVQFSFDSPLVKEQESLLTFHISDLSGAPVSVEPYLGASMHLVVVSEDTREYVHTHPEEMAGHTRAPEINFFPVARAHGGIPDEIEEEAVGIKFHASFPKAGRYRAFAQFRPQGANLGSDEALIASFWLNVEEGRPPFGGISPKVVLVLVSLLLIGLVSMIVKKYLTV